jgi:aminopeptidase N
VRLYFPLLLSIFLGGCSNLDYFLTTGTVKLTERNRLLGELLPERACYDILFYDINIEIDVDKKYIKGYVDFTALAVENFEKLQVDLAKSMQLNNVEYNGKILSTNRKEDAVYINFPKITAGSEFTFRVYYEGSPQVAKNPPWDGGFVWEKDEAGRDYVSVACEGDGCGLWWPLKDHISDEPDKGARMSFTVPKELMCVSNGRLIDASDNDNGTRTYIWQVVNPINNYNISVQLGNYVSLVDTVHRSNGKIETMNHYVLDYHKEVASTVFPQARKVIRFFEKNFGDYQFWEDGFKLVEVSYLGMEHQSAVTYGNVWSNWGGDHRSWTRDYYGIIDGLLFHETAHEWWGNSVTAKDPAHVWIHEGMAVYSEAMFIEQELGYNVMIDFMRKKRRFQNISPIVGPENENYWAFGDSYNKGAWAMHTLRHVVNNDNLWWDTIKTFATENAKSNVNTKDFISHVENKTKMPLSYFFDQYFFDKRIPTLQYFQVGNQFHYRWADTVSDFAMPINIEINGQEKRIIPKIEKQTLTISEHSVVHVKDWQFLLNKKRVQM